MARLSKSLAGLVTRLVQVPNREEAKIESQQLRRTLERLLMRGLSDTELLNALQLDHWQNRIAVCMCEAGQTWEAAT